MSKNVNKAKINVEFNEATTRENLVSGESVNTLFGKIKKFLSDLHDSAFTGNAAKVNNHTVNTDVPSDAKFTDTTYSNATTSAAGLMSAADKAKLNEMGAIGKGIVTLQASNWNSNSQEVSSSVATADNVIIVSPIPDDQDTYSKCGIKCSAQSNGSLTFTCDALPTTDIHVNVVTF